MFSTDEAFPNSEQLLKEAFAATDPVLPLLKLLNEHETYPAVCELVISYIEEVEETPSRGHHLACSLARLTNVYDSPQAPAFRPDTLRWLVAKELAGHHFKVAIDDFVNKGYSPYNTYLLNSLLSGLSLKYGLTATPEMSGAINDGLAARHGSENAQVLVVGSCIQLLLHGASFVTNERTAEEIASNLKAQKAMGIVKNPYGIQLLELSIIHAETGFKPENDFKDDIWALLFPGW